MRVTPNLDSEVSSILNRGTTLTFAGEISDKKETVRLGGNTYSDFFYKVTTKGGKTGWVHGATLR